MKKILLVAVLIALSFAHVFGQSFMITERGPHHRVWSRVTSETNRLGKVMTRTNSYTELETGMHYLQNGQWAESKAEIKVTPDGAEAMSGPHKVKFTANLNSTNSVDLTTPDGQGLRSHVVGLAYYDDASGQSVMIAVARDSMGELHPPNRAVYPNAFDGLEADVEYIYTKAGFEQNVVLREQPPSPEKWDLNPETTRLQVLTEFFNPPSPQRVSAMKGGVETDQALQFGQMTIGQGKAFSVGEETQRLKAMDVDKRWLNLKSGRTVLVEEIKLEALNERLQALPAKRTASLSPTRTATGDTLLAAIDGLLPRTQSKPKQGEMRLAQAEPSPRSGFVLDYLFVNSASNFTFKGDTTYYVTNFVNLSGTTAIEGGAIVKFSPNWTSKISVYDTLQCLTDEYRPAIFTSKDDNTVGEPIAGSSGNPSGTNHGYPGVFMGAPSLFVGTSDGTTTVKYMRFTHLGYCMEFDNFPQTNVISHVQMVDSETGIGGIFSQLRLRNVLAANMGWGFFASGFQASVEHLTANNVSNVFGSEIIGQPTDPIIWMITNSVFANVTSITWPTLGNDLSFLVGDYNGFYNCSQFGSHTLYSATPIFQTIGTGAHYLTNNSPFRNAGTPNISSTLAADLTKKTTYPPGVYASQYITNDLVLSPRAQRDTDTPDLGYHYDPLDYAFGVVATSTNVNVTLAPGTALATFSLGSGQNYGLALLRGGKLVSKGNPTAPAWIVQYNTVQEPANTAWTNTLQDACIQPEFVNSLWQSEVTCRFTKWSVLGAGNQAFTDISASSQSKIALRDSEFYGGGFTVYGGNASFTNCLFDRVYLSVFDLYWPGDVMIQNATFHGGTLDSYHFQTGDFMIRNSLFDQTQTVQYDLPLTNEYNGYVTGSTRLDPTNAHDVVANLTFLSGPLGRFYLPSDSQLIDACSVTAPSVGLYHFTTQTSEFSKEATSKVDIGFHYVGCDSSGTPLDSDNDGVSDSLEDANGNGSVDSGETDWQNASDMGLRVFITEPKRGASLP